MLKMIPGYIFHTKHFESNASSLFLFTMIDVVEFFGNTEGLFDAISTKYLRF
jgi:hypothetical protein